MPYQHKGKRDFFPVKMLHGGKEGGRDWSDISIRQGMPRITNKCQKLEEGKKNSPLWVSEGAWPY